MTAVSAPSVVTACVLFLHRRLAPGSGPPGAAPDPIPPALQSALAGWEAQRRVVLDAGGDLAVVGEVAPSAVLEAARRLVAAAPAGSVAVALHRGPVRAAPDGTGAARISGDAIETARALAGLQAGHPIVTSLALRDALAAESPRLAGQLRSAGEQVDANLRSHAVYLFDPELARQRVSRRRLLHTLALVSLLGVGWAGRQARHAWEEAHRPAVLLLDIRPASEVFVDGELMGSTPQLARLNLPPGPHTIEIRSGRARPLRLQVQLKPGEEFPVRHVFAPPARRAPAPAPPPPRPGPLDRFRFW